MEEQNGPGLQDILAGIRRRVLLIAAVFVTGSALAVAVASSLPATYSSTAKILVESQQIPNDLARSTVTASAAERLQVIQQVLMTRENLLDVASELNLFADRPQLSPTERVEAMRAATEIRPITFGSRRSSQVTAFTITYRSSNRDETVVVANELVTRVLEQNLRQRSLRATETNDFFKSEIDRLGQQIKDTERQLTAFKTENMDRLPDGQETRQRELSMMQERQFDREKRRFQLEEQKRLLTEMLANGLPVDPRQLSPEERELEELRRTLTMRRAVLASSHPQIRSIERRIEVLEGLLQPASATEEGESGPSPAERRVHRQLELLDRELDLLRKQDEADEARRVALQEAIEASPSVALALGDLSRRYEDLKFQRENTMRKQVEAAMGERLEVTQKAERFEVIEQAQRPSAPDAPNRMMIAAAGGAGSLGLGLGLAVLLELLSGAIRNPGQLERSTGLRAFVTVPWIPTAADRRRRRRQIVMGVATVAIGVPLLLFAVDRQVMPLPVLADRVIEKSGIERLAELFGVRFGG